MKRRIVLVVLMSLPLALIAMAFTLLNDQAVSIELFVVRPSLKLGEGLALTFLLGAIIGMVVGMAPLYGKNGRIKQLEKENAQQREALEKLQ